MPRILVADDHELVRRMICEVLEARTGWEVCEEAASGAEAIRMADRTKPDIVVLDLSMPELNGFETTREILRQAPQTKVLILTMHDPKDFLNGAMASGARAYVLKSNLDDLVAAIRDVLQHDSQRSKVGASTQEVAKDLPTEELTETEREIVRLLARARSDTQIAAALSLSVEAVVAQRAVIMRKLTISSLFELVQYAVRQKLVEVKPSPAQNRQSHSAS